MQRLLTTAIAITAACRLDSLVEDEPGASTNILPPGAIVPDVASSADLTSQLRASDGLNTNVLAASNDIIVRGTGQSGGSAVRFWAFGPATRAPAPLYLFGTTDGSGVFHRNQHLPLADAMPGDYAYNPIHTILHVNVTERYQGELITTPAALADAIQLGLVEPPEATGTAMVSPIVRPGLLLEVDEAAGVPVTAPPTKVYARGHVMESFEVGTTVGPQPNPYGLLPTSQVSYLREQLGPTYDATRPIFQATIPTGPPGKMPNYMPLSVIINVDLVGDASSITKDGDLFTRDTDGAITAVKPAVAHFMVDSTVVLQIQFTEGMP